MNQRGIRSMQRISRTVRSFLLLVLGLSTSAVVCSAAAQEQAVVRAVLFFSPTCPHCHQVINEDLPVIFDIYGGTPRVWYDQTVAETQRAFYYITNGQLEVLLVDASKPNGGSLYVESTRRFNIPQPRSGVPRLIVGDSVLVGSLEIPQIFPRLIDEAMGNGGLDWPAIEGLESMVPVIPESPVVVAQREDSGPASPQEALADSAPQEPVAADTQPTRAADATAESPQDPAPPPPVTADTAGASAPMPPDTGAAAQAPANPAESTSPPASVTLGDIPVSRLSMFENFRQDPVGNGASVVVLVVMIVSVLLVARLAPARGDQGVLGLAIPVLALGGIVVAGYLTYVEMSGAVAVCGPVGDCNTVQQSAYAKLFGAIPVGLLGLLSYIFVVGAWGVMRWATVPASDWARVALLAVAFVGTVFSIYLTFLEPFVIGATCMWCLSSSLIITALLWLTAGPGTAAWSRLTSARRPPASGTS
jgi:uncharacterized membrane protein